MSKLNLYAVFDKKADAFNAPVVIASDAVAIRNIRAVMATEKSLFSQFPDDFSLVKVAEFDQASGLVSPCKQVVLVTFAGLVEDSPNNSN